MRSKIHKQIAVAGALAIGVALASAGPAFAAGASEGAAADHVVEASEIADRVIYKLDEHKLDAPVQARLSAVPGTVTVVTPAEPVPADEQPALGETVIVYYADATVVHQAVALACTVTGTAGTPAKVSNLARGTTQYTQNGCSGIESSTGMLQIYFGFNWLTQASQTTPATNGNTVTNYHTWSCSNSNSSPWRTAVANKYPSSSATILNVSSTVNLACGR